MSGLHGPGIDWEIGFEESHKAIEGYRSYSLVIVSSPAWLLSEKKNDIEQLHDLFMAFGRAIGSEHVAIWPWKDKEKFLIDADTTVAYCKKFKLSLEGGPYIVMNVDVPHNIMIKADSLFETGSSLIIDLNGLRACQTMPVLSALANQIVHEKIDQSRIDSVVYWRKWKSVVESLFEGAGRLAQEC